MNDLRHFRDCLGRFATGVTVITCGDLAGAPTGITANSFSSVCLEPPLILWNIAKVSRSLDAFLGAKYFGINVLSDSQQRLAGQFARSDSDLFAGIEHGESTNGVPRLGETLAWFECRTHQIHDCGDHFIIIGEVTEYAAGDGRPLLFFGGAYARLAPS